jgi:aldose 1-epimerase
MLAATPSLLRESFGELAGGRPVERVRLRDASGFEACVITYGAALQALMVPDAQGALADVVLGHDTAAAYAVRRDYYGVTVGRFANRIAGAAFTVDGVPVTLEANDGANTLHGGFDGFDCALWAIAALDDGAAPAVTLSHRSPHGAGGFPGTLDVGITYRITGPGELTFACSAVTDRPTMVSLTNHSFFNLDGVETGGDILGHRLTLAADDFLATNAAAIPLSGSPRPVAGTPFDFRAGATIGARIRDHDGQLRAGRGYDHNFCLGAATGPRFVARAEAERSGRIMELFTDQPGVQLYSGNYLDGAAPGKYRRLHRQSDAFCLEPQAWPDAPNRPDFPSARLDPGDTYRHVSIYRFFTV